MIGRLSGKLIEKNPPQILLDVQGVGYEVDVPMSTFYNLPELNQPLSLYTQLVVREDAQLLYGFLTVEERIAFRQLVKISGVGAKLALAVLSGMSLSELSTAIASKDVSRMTKVPGIGKKTAERLLLELQGKFAVYNDGPTSSAPSAVASHQDDIENALLALGYSSKEATVALKQLPPDIGVSAGIKLALKQLSKS